ncbi:MULTISPECIES: helix-turn-helix domain-containing protein [Pseudomonas syringae group]|uniref:XRE family transcriptional regulator n=4 Tax=Pseudomonas syringae group TaxID=136849 RepID=A0AAD0GQ92_9PSED|nr:MULTISPECIES: helix-turn-helix transcriptional regulator [Pseudomonas syringae group]EPN03192.1 transcriptional regulator [Pseudomonas syringae pv. actinidiae ICMP 19070]AQL36221.1 transcriptional regulator [Pseudomonas syringae pv. actinidiae ICMP 9853]AVB21815.1 XRE family transcriptional regulator [Pseudomonas avellanae]EGH11990.1 transcriptional regulator, XRE family protein [Pseudomonas amygdali pv. morsprunorum str. M302280]EGH66374.1 transcriptional regulator, XRE family protein [Pse
MNFLGMTDEAIAVELGVRIQRQRLNRNKTQEQIAEAVGVSKPTIVQLERGHAKLTTLIAVMRALDIIDQVNQIVPDVPVSPVQVYKMSGAVRKRASSKVRRISQDRSSGDAEAAVPKVLHGKRLKKDDGGW